MDATTAEPQSKDWGGPLFGRKGILAMLGLAGLAAWYGLGIAVFLAGTVVSLSLLAHAWSRAALARLAYGRRLTARRAFPDDVIECAIELDNRKLLPLVWVHAAEQVPDALAPDPADLPPGITWTQGELAVDTSLLWYQRASWRYGLRCRRRGYYAFGPATVTSADVFGLFARTRKAAGIVRVAVFPHIHPLADLGLPAAAPLGEVKAPNPLFQDPVRIRGLRDYTPEVPFRHIHWKASARTGALQAKVFEPTSTTQVLVVVDAAGFVAGETFDEAGFELALSVAASVGWHAAEEGCGVGLCTNTRLAGGGPWALIKPAAGLDHLGDVLETLARAVPRVTPFDQVLDALRPEIAAGTTLIVVAGGLRPEVEATLAELHGEGFPVSVLIVGDGPTGDTALPCRRVRRPADLALA